MLQLFSDISVENNCMRVLTFNIISNIYVYLILKLFSSIWVGNNFMYVLTFSILFIIHIYYIYIKYISCICIYIYIYIYQDSGLE